MSGTDRTDKKKNYRYSYGAAVILYYPDQKCIDRISNYSCFQKTYIFENTENPDKHYVNQLKTMKKVRYFQLNENMGISGALNFLFSMAASEKIDFLLTMDQDTDFNRKQILRMIRFIEQDMRTQKIAVYCSNYRKIYADKNGRETFGSWRIPKNKTVYCKTAMTAGSFYRIKAVQEILPLPDLFIGFVDYDMAYRLRELGYFICMIGSVCISQRVGMPVANNICNQFLHKVNLSPERYYYMGRNSRYLLKVYQKNKKIWIDIMIKRVRIIINILVCEEAKITKLKEWIKGSHSPAITVRGTDYDAD